MAVAPGLSVAELAERLGGELRGEGSARIRSLATPARAGTDQLCFVSDSKYLPQLQASQAGAVLLRGADAGHCPRPAIVVDNPYLAYARASQLLHPQPPVSAGVHTSAVVDPNARIDPGAEIGPQAVVEADAVIGAGAVVGAGSYVGRGAVLGDGTRLAPRVVVHHDCVLGRDCSVLSGSVIGADGFGYAPAGADGWQRIEQIGRVRIGDRVEIGACTTVDRGALDDTVIEDGVIIDNHVQIAHNVHIGAGTAIAGCVGIAGSTHIGRRCQLGGGSSIVGHIHLEDGVVVFANTFVTSSLRAGVYASATAAQPVADWRRNQPNLRQLHQLARRLRRLLGRSPSAESPESSL